MNKVFSLKFLPFFIAITVLLIVVFWFEDTSMENLVQEKSLKSSPDYFITELNVKEFNTDGALIETLNATQALHYIEGSKTLLESPNVKRKSESGSWSAKADKGIIEDGSNDILLLENASATKKHLTSNEIVLNADTVHYLDKNQSLTSSGNAMLLSIQGRTFANKITTFINSEKVVMTGSVRGKYETIH